MTPYDITSERLCNQLIGCTNQDKVEGVVGWLGAVQAQDPEGAQWSAGLRLPGSTAADIGKAVAGRKIVLTWALRGTLHLVAAADIRWMLALLAPGIRAKRALRYRQLGLSPETFAAANQIMVQELEGGQPRTRTDLLAVLERAGISTADQRGYHLLGRAGLDGVICFGPPEGRQQTFVLLDDWVPHSPEMDRSAAMAELGRRYIASHGPATLKDFTWWSGLPAADARSALAGAGPGIRRKTRGSREYWLPEPVSPSRRGMAAAVLLPAYDEYLLGYQDRSHALDPRDAGKINLINGLARPILVSGRIRGSWKRVIAPEKIMVTINYFEPQNEDAERAVEAAVKRYGAFIGKPVGTT
jgi:hypothetical protein